MPDESEQNFLLQTVQAYAPRPYAQVHELQDRYVPICASEASGASAGGADNFRVAVKFLTSRRSVSDESDQNFLLQTVHALPSRPVSNLLMIWHFSLSVSTLGAPSILFRFLLLHFFLLNSRATTRY